MKPRNSDKNVFRYPELYSQRLIPTFVGNRTFVRIIFVRRYICLHIQICSKKNTYLSHMILKKLIFLIYSNKLFLAVGLFKISKHLKF